MGKTKQNAIVFCGKTEIPQYMKQVVGWLENNFCLTYIEMLGNQGAELYFNGPVRYVFMLLDLKEGDKRIIREIVQKTEPQIGAFLEGPDTQLPSSFRLILEVKTASSETDPEEFNPCLITFSEDYLGWLGECLRVFGVNLHVNQSDPIFHDEPALLAAIASSASEQDYVEEVYKTL